MKKPLRKVLSHQYVGACRYSGYIDRSIRLTLECGHDMVRKASAGVPKKAGCFECSYDAQPDQGGGVE